MKAIILAAGKGTRMRELTNELPKPMLRVPSNSSDGKPILEHIIAGLVRADVREIFIVTGFHAEVIERYFAEGTRWNARIAFGRQVSQDGTGKAAEPARSFVGDSPFILTYGDILVNPDTYARMIRRFHEGNFSGVITVTRGADVTKGGLDLFDKDFCLSRLIEKPTLAQVEQLHREGVLRADDPIWYNSGIYLFKPSVFEFMARLEKSPRGEYELTDAVSAMVAAKHRIAGLEIEGRWVDVRDPEVLAQLEQDS